MGTKRLHDVVPPPGSERVLLVGHAQRDGHDLPRSPMNLLAYHLVERALAVSTNAGTKLSATGDMRTENQPV